VPDGTAWILQLCLHRYFVPDGTRWELVVFGYRDAVPEAQHGSGSFVCTGILCLTAKKRIVPIGTISRWQFRDMQDFFCPVRDNIPVAVQG